MNNNFGEFFGNANIFKILGCQKQPNKTDDNVVGVRISCNHMAFSFSYSFKLYQKEGKTLFSCDCSIDKETKNDVRVNCENLEVDDKYFDQLIEILIKNNITNEVVKYKEKINWFFVADKTDYKITLFFENGDFKDAKINFKELYKFFKELASLYATEVTYE